MDKRFEVTLQNDIKTNVWFTTDNNEMNEKILSLSPSYLIVTDENSLKYSPDKERTVVLKSGEENKNWESLEEILSFALNHSMARDGVFVAIGGGVVCDMTALASALFMRGARLVLCPTTLLSMGQGCHRFYEYKKHCRSFLSGGGCYSFFSCSFHSLR